MWCPKIIYVHLVKTGRGVGTPLLDLYFDADTLGSHGSKWLSGSSILCQSIQFRLNQAYGKSPNIEVSDIRQVAFNLLILILRGMIILHYVMIGKTYFSW